MAGAVSRSSPSAHLLQYFDLLQPQRTLEPVRVGTRANARDERKRPPGPPVSSRQPGDTERLPGVPGVVHGDENLLIRSTY